MDIKQFVLFATLLSGTPLGTFAETQQNVKVTLSMRNVSIKDVLDEVEKQTNYLFVIDNDVNLNKKVSVNIKFSTLRNLLQQVLVRNGYAYDVKEHHIIVSKMGQWQLQKAVNRVGSLQTTTKGDKNTLTGKVIDAKTGEPVIGASVRVKNSKMNGITNVNGEFSINNIPGDAELIVSYIGYEESVVHRDNLASVIVQLREKSKSLDEVVVVGYGSQKKSDLTGVVTSIGADKLNNVSTDNVLDKLAGQVPGLNIVSTNAQPGSDQTLRVRGNNSLTASTSPLVVLDGIPYSGSLGDINPDIIESISVLKDASSAAIYGSRGANGVILIQTKQGKEGRVSVTYKGQVGMAEPERRLKMMNGTQYIQYLKDLQHQLYGTPYEQLNPETVLGSDEYENYKAGRETDWQDIIFRKALVTSHQISISGGTKNTTYMASIGRFRQDGVVENTGLKRTNISVNVTQNLKNWLKIGMNVQAVQKDFGGVRPDIEAAIKMSPYGTYKDEKGNLVYKPMVRNSLYSNPMSDVNAINDKTNRNVFISSFAEITLPLGFSVRSNFGYNYRANFQGTYYGRNTLTGKSVNGSASITNTHYWDYTWENILRWTKSFKRHRLDATGLFSLQKTNTETSTQSAESFVSDANEYHNMESGEKNKETTSSLVETALISYMMRVNYSYASKYLLTLTGRTDGYSAFGKNNKYAFFPSAAVAWNVSEEQFMENSRSWLDMLKFRLSYGANGNQAINAYQTLDRLGLTQYVFGDGGSTVNGLYLTSNGVGNPNLKWETTYKLNLGFDWGILGGRLSGSVDFYISKTKDLLMSRTVPYMNGYRSIMDNVGQTQNKGVEIVLNSVNIQTKDFTWNTTVNFTLNRDKIVKLRGDGKDDITNKWFIGKPTMVYYDYNVIGTWQENDSRWDAASKKYLNSEGNEIQKGAKPGSAMLEDVNGDGVIDANDKKVIGSKLPSFLMSMTNSFTYKNFYCSFFLNGLFGEWKQMHDKNFDRWMKDFNYLSDMNYWTSSNPTNSMTSIVYVPFNKHSFYKKMSYIQIKNITLGYNLPKRFVNSIGLSSVKVDISVNNLYTFSNIKNALNFDNVSSSGDEYGLIVGYPTARSYMFGLNVAF